jgi:2-iminoacetate synthase ThiH
MPKTITSELLDRYRKVLEHPDITIKQRIEVLKAMEGLRMPYKVREKKKPNLLGRY